MTEYQNRKFRQDLLHINYIIERELIYKNNVAAVVVSQDFLSKTEWVEHLTALRDSLKEKYKIERIKDNCVKFFIFKISPKEETISELE